MSVWRTTSILLSRSFDSNDMEPKKQIVKKRKIAKNIFLFFGNFIFSFFVFFVDVFPVYHFDTDGKGTRKSFSFGFLLAPQGKKNDTKKKEGEEEEEEKKTKQKQEEEARREKQEKQAERE